MLLSFGIGSIGAGQPSYAMRLPFHLSPGRTLKLADGSQFELLGHSCEIAQEYNQYTLIATGFDTEDAAAIFLLQACAGLIWYGLNNSVGLQFQADTTPIKLLEKPKPIAEGSSLAPIAANKGWREYDGHYDADKTVIRPDHKRLIVFAAGSVTPRFDTPISVLSNGMHEGMVEGHPERVLRNPKLRLACEVYMSSHFESTPAASFLSRITTLEILTADTPASEPVWKMVTQFMNETTEAQQTEQDVAVKREYESLLSRLEHLRNQSIKSGIRQVVEAGLRTDSDITASSAVAREVSRLYDLRSTLVHKGEVNPKSIRDGNNRLDEVVPLILRTHFREASQGT
jgi:hypothetical protein